MNSETLSGGLRTVTHLAIYFQELKQSAIALAARITAQKRGYFTPEEDDEVRAVLVSYWQVRNALYDLITNFRTDRDLTAEQRPAAFLTAYAATLLLIDAARFLRELAESRPIVRRKFNEPALQLGVPEGVYDTVQKSLVSTRHAWHVYHAIRYFEEHQEELRALGADPKYRPVLEVIDEFQHRLNVSAARFAEVKLRTRADQLLRKVARDTLGRALYGLNKMGGNLISDVYVRSGHEPGVPPEIARQIRALLAPGDVLVVRKEYALTNYFLPGYWPHAALYLGDSEAMTSLGLHECEHVQPRWRRMLEAAPDEPGTVLEAMRDGVQFRSLASPLHSDSIVVVRPRLSPGDIARGLARVIVHEGKPYDFDFDFTRSDRLVCTEVVFRAFDGLGPISFTLTRRAGRLTLSGNDLIELALQRNQFDPIAVYVPRFQSALVTGADQSADQAGPTCDAAGIRVE